MDHPEGRTVSRSRGRTIFNGVDTSIDENFIEEGINELLDAVDYAQELQPDAVDILAYQLLRNRQLDRNVVAVMSEELTGAFRKAFKKAVKIVSANSLYEMH